jgi:hypothetical protein
LTKLPKNDIWCVNSYQKLDGKMKAVGKRGVLMSIFFAVAMLTIGMVILATPSKGTFTMNGKTLELAFGIRPGLDINDLALLLRPFNPSDQEGSAIMQAYLTSNGSLSEMNSKLSTHLSTERLSKLNEVLSPGFYCAYQLSMSYGLSTNTASTFCGLRSRYRSDGQSHFKKTDKVPYDAVLWSNYEANFLDLFPRVPHEEIVVLFPLTLSYCPSWYYALPPRAPIPGPKPAFTYPYPK